MSITTYWSPNQAAVAQVETYTFTAPSGAGNTYTATINGKVLTYTADGTETAAEVATAMFNLLNQSSGIASELTEIQFANPSDGVVTATARTAGTPFANVTVGGVSGQGLVMSTGNGLASGIATAHTTANTSPSDVFDPQNWVRADLSTTPPNRTRALPQNGDDVVVANTRVGMLWNLDRLASVQFATYERHQSFTGTIGLPDANAGGYIEWRATYLKLTGPSGSVPAGGLSMILGVGDGDGPSRERYDLGSSRYTLTVLAAGSPADNYGVNILGQHTANAITVVGGATLSVAMAPGEKANLLSLSAADGTDVGIGPEVTWLPGSTMSLNGSSALLLSAPATVTMDVGSRLTVYEDGLTWASITARGGSSLAWFAGGIVTSLTMETGSSLDKSGDARTLTITNSTIDGDSCRFIDPLNAIVWTNATTVKQSVSSGPFAFTGPRTVKVT